MRLRQALDRLYRHSRSVESGLDPEVSTKQLLAFICRKACHGAVGIVRMREICLVAPSARIRSKRDLRLGRLVSIGERVEIDATSANGVQLGDSVTIDTGAVIRASGVLRNRGVGVVIGERSAVGAFNFLHGGGGIVIGRDCLLGPNVGVFSENHVIQDAGRPIREQGEVRSPVRLGDDVWVGAGATVLAGVSVGDGAVIGAGAVVTRDVPSCAVVGGVPAKVIGMRG